MPGAAATLARTAPGRVRTHRILATPAERIPLPAASIDAVLVLDVPRAGWQLSVPFIAGTATESQAGDDNRADR